MSDACLHAIKWHCHSFSHIIQAMMSQFYIGIRYLVKGWLPGCGLQVQKQLCIGGASSRTLYLTYFKYFLYFLSFCSILYTSRFRTTINTAHCFGSGLTEHHQRCDDAWEPQISVSGHGISRPSVCDDSRSFSPAASTDSSIKPSVTQRHRWHIQVIWSNFPWTVWLI